MKKLLLCFAVLIIWTLLTISWIKLGSEICSKDVGVDPNPTDFLGTGVFHQNKEVKQ
jgi:hypothetical protein